VLGRSEAKVDQIAARDVSSEQIGFAMVEKLAPNRAQTDV
jgi:hypothetical protein